MFDNRLDGMEAMHARDMAAQTQLRFSLSKNHNFQRPEGQMSAMRPFPAPRYQMENLMNSNSPSNPYQPVSDNFAPNVDNGAGKKFSNYTRQIIIVYF